MFIPMMQNCGIKPVQRAEPGKSGARQHKVAAKRRGGGG